MQRFCVQAKTHRDGAEGGQQLSALRPTRRPRADFQKRQLLDRREPAEELLEALVLPHERAIGAERGLRQRLDGLAGAFGRPRAGDLRERGEKGGGQRGLEVPVGQPGQAVLEGDRLALLGELQAPGRMPRRLREDRRMRGASPAPGAAAAPVEDRQLDSALIGEGRQPLLGAEDLPLRRQIAAVLARVGVADHDLQPPAPRVHQRREARFVQERLDDRGRLAEVADRLEERNRRDSRSRLCGRVDDGKHVTCRLRAGDDDGVDRTLAELRLRVGDRGERFADPR